jgi:hypothetical protein
MAIIRCTARLLKELRVKPAIVPGRPPGLDDWHANLLYLNRKKYILFTNSLTLYSHLMHWAKTPRPMNFAERFRLSLFNSLMGERLDEAQVDYMMRQHAQITITKTSSRSILASMNDITFRIKYYVYMDGLTDIDWSEMSEEINIAPMGAIKYQSGIDELRRRLADALK